MKFKSNINIYYKDRPKEYRGITSANYNIGKDGLNLSSYLYTLIRSNVEFALDCGISTGEANSELEKFKQMISEVFIKDSNETDNS
jgi:hypothetical protein